jgi:hypothetical protein
MAMRPVLLVRDLREALRGVPDTAAVDPWVSPTYDAKDDTLRLWPSSECGRCGEDPDVHVCPDNTYKPKGSGR